MNRRTVLIGGSALTLAGIGLLVARPEDAGGMHNAYFSGLAAAIRRAGLNKPVLVIDRKRLDANIQRVRQSVSAAGLPLRVVAKSLPSPLLLDRILTGMATQRLMVFSADMLRQLMPIYPQADYLGGKPLPVREFIRVVDDAATNPGPRMQWLIDTPHRLNEYAEAAKARGMALRVSLEIDVGLHRGGFADAQTLSAALVQAKAAGIEVAGLMGYDPHVPKMPSPESAWVDAQNAYRTSIEILRSAGRPANAMTLNSAGSPTFRRHCQGTVANEVSVGSAFVKPGDFDYEDLADLVPAAFIATPVIKASNDLPLPGIEPLSGAMHWWDRNTTRGFFIHGGHWLAKPVSPPGLQYSKLMGRSSNQELLTGSTRVELRPDDTVFLRPDQSEALFLQFGDIAVYDGRDIVEMWPTLPISA
ncbi:DSD1 family PLP-dependent enzyme [Sphingomonas lacunae]|uniref:DSD1 family PLP-dependent enzyme n=1 Tax=Sphingomonas lacunae TaxID=2698828 RepID=A0A6M4AZX6_9SPHN|nr:alanine racemase [Sphingomonas lacunae]QJQ32601.1 DSD1 family PLP-dependent enzyme [Sphingomonas lacunae]